MHPRVDAHPHGQRKGPEGESSTGPAGILLGKERLEQLFAYQVENREKMDKFMIQN